MLPGSQFVENAPTVEDCNARTGFSGLPDDVAAELDARYDAEPSLTDDELESDWRDREIQRLREALQKIAHTPFNPADRFAVYRVAAEALMPKRSA
jgi:hypothetical protein